jgi:hypothetical protein
MSKIPKTHIMLETLDLKADNVPFSYYTKPIRSRLQSGLCTNSTVYLLIPALFCSAGVGMRKLTTDVHVFNGWNVAIYIRNHWQGWGECNSLLIWGKSMKKQTRKMEKCGRKREDEER